MTTPGRAAITIVGDASKLGAQLERDAQAAISGVDLNMEPISDQIGDGFREGAREGELAFRDAAADIAASAQMIALAARRFADITADAWERAGERMERSFAEARREAVADQGEIAAAATAVVSTLAQQGNALSKIFSKIGQGIATTAVSLGSLAAAELNPAGLAATLISIAVTLAAIALLAGPLLVVAAALSQLAGGLVLIPAAGAVAAAAIGTLIIAFHGFGDAISAIIDGDPEKIAEALKKLAPEARAVAQEFQKLLPSFREIGQLVQQRFFIQLEGDLTRLAKVALPTVRDGLSEVATSLGQVVSRIADTLSTPEAAGQFKVIFDETAEAIHAAASDFNRFTAGLLAAASALAPTFGDLSQTITDIVGDFGDWLSTAAKDGTLQEFLDKAIATGKSLLNLFGSVGSLIGTLFGGNAADEGRNFIDTLTEGINDFNAALKSEEGQKVLAEIVTSAKLLGIAIGKVVGVIGFFIDVLAGIHDAGLAVIDFFDRAGNDIARFWDGLTSGASDAADGVTGFFTGIGSAIADFWNGLVDTVSDAVGSVITFFEELPGNIADFLAALPGMVADFFDAAINRVIDTLALGIAAVIVFFVNLPGQVMGALAALVMVVGDMLRRVGEIAAAAWDGIVAFFQSLPQRLSEVWATIVEQATAALTAIGDWAVDVWNKIVDFFSRLPGMIGAFFVGVYNAAVEKLTSLINWVKSLPGRIMSALGDFGSLLYNSGARVIQGLIDGIASKFTRLREKIAEGVGIIRDHLPFSPAKTGPLSGSGSPEIAGAVIGEMIAAGLDSQLPLIANAAGRAAGAASPLGAIGQAGVTPLLGTAPGVAGQSVLSPLAATSQQLPVIIVQIGNEEIDAHIDRRVEQGVAVEVRRLTAGTRGIG